MRKTFFHSISENLILERIDGIGKTNANSSQNLYRFELKNYSDLSISHDSVIYFDPFRNAEKQFTLIHYLIENLIAWLAVTLIQCHTEQIIFILTDPVRVQNCQMICFLNT